VNKRRGREIQVVLLEAVVIGIGASMPLVAIANEAWISMPVERSGGFISLTCQSDGPSRDISYRLALQSCRSMAADNIDSSARTKTLIVESESDLAMHSETESNHTIQGLDCLEQKIRVSEYDGGYRTLLRCKFSLAGAKVVSTADAKIQEIHQAREESTSLIADPGLAHIKQRKGDTPKRGAYLQSHDRPLILTTIPKAESVLIVNTKGSRVVRIRDNPTTLSISPDDTQIIIRAKGFSPTHLNLSKRNNPDALSDAESLEVALER
jgi:hypothetical protein